MTSQNMECINARAKYENGIDNYGQCIVDVTD